MVLIGVALGAVALGAIVTAQTNKPSSISNKSAVTNKLVTELPTTLAGTSRKPLDFYTGGVRADLFAPSADTASKPKIDIKKSALPILPDIAPAAVDPFSDYSYTGTVTMNGEMSALVETSSTHSGRFLKVGDTFVSGKVTAITDRSVTIDVEGKQEMIAKSDTYKLTPLDKSAAYLTAQPGQGGAAGAQGQFSMQNLPPNMAATFQNMTPEQKQAIIDRINSRMQGGGGGARGGFGGMGGGNGAGFGGMGGGGGRGNRGNRGGGGGFGGGGNAGGGFGGGGFGGATMAAPANPTVIMTMPFGG